jgi:hypothetical protein
MEERIKLIEHRGQQVLLLDYSNLTSELLASYCVNGFEFTKSLGRTDLLILVDVTDTFTYGKGYEALKKAAINTIPFTRKDALVGISGAKTVLLNVFNALRRTGTRAFPDREKALDFLVSDAGVS